MADQGVRGQRSHQTHVAEGTTACITYIIDSSICDATRAPRPGSPTVLLVHYPVHTSVRTIYKAVLSYYQERADWLYHATSTWHATCDANSPSIQLYSSTVSGESLPHDSRRWQYFTWLQNSPMLSWKIVDFSRPILILLQKQS